MPRLLTRLCVSPAARNRPDSFNGTGSCASFSLAGAKTASPLRCEAPKACLICSCGVLVTQAPLGARDASENDTGLLQGARKDVYQNGIVPTND